MLFEVSLRYVSHIPHPIAFINLKNIQKSIGRDLLGIYAVKFVKLG